MYITHSRVLWWSLTAPIVCCNWIHICYLSSNSSTNISLLCFLVINYLKIKSSRTQRNVYFQEILEKETNNPVLFFLYVALHLEAIYLTNQTSFLLRLLIGFLFHWLIVEIKKIDISTVKLYVQFKIALSKKWKALRWYVECSNRLKGLEMNEVTHFILEEG